MKTHTQHEFMIRKFQATDMFSTIRIASETLTEQYTPSLFNYFYETFPELFLIAEKHHKIIGFITGIQLTEEITRIVMLSILPTYQRQHIATELLNELLHILIEKNVKQISLEVKTDNKKAISFYKKHGFTIIDTIEKFYQNGENAFMMTRLLQPY